MIITKMKTMKHMIGAQEKSITFLHLSLVGSRDVSVQIPATNISGTCTTILTIPCNSLFDFQKLHCKISYSLIHINKGFLWNKGFYDCKL